MLTALQIGFWVSLAAVFSTYLFYPVALLLLTPFRKKHRIDESFTPSVTLVISAYNEESVIREKLENALSLDYPRDQLEVMVISDESDDRTDEIVNEFLDQGVVLYRQEPRLGKSAGLTKFVPAARGEFVVFSDANSIYEEGALRKLVRHFAEPSVGFVVGHQRYLQDETAACDSESMYWKYETWIKIHESRIGSVVCGDGAIYAIRRELFEPLQPDDINDFTLPLKIVSRGYRGIFDREAVCYERTADDFGGEFRRKTRIVNRSFRAVTRVPQALNPFGVGFFSLQLFVHKILRWFVSFFLAALIVINIALVAQSAPLVYTVLMGAQVVCYGLALLWFVPGFRRLRLVYIAYYFCLVNLAACLGILGFFLGKRISTWSPERSASEGTQETAAATH